MVLHMQSLFCILPQPQRLFEFMLSMHLLNYVAARLSDLLLSTTLIHSIVTRHIGNACKQSQLVIGHESLEKECRNQRHMASSLSVYL